ncbi:MAG: indolepyruvate oxidoreductase subunit beta family protein [Terriglobales bacterium]
MSTAPQIRARAISVAILAMGGEGGGVLADWIVDVAEKNGYLAQTTSVPGVAQRTGATIYYIEMFPEAEARAEGKDPVLALMPVPGEVDVVIASELMEMGRAVQRGLVTPDRTTLVASTHRVYSMTEKIAMGDGRVDTEVLIESGKKTAKKFVAGDYARIASEHQSVISAALLGALARSEALRFTREQYANAIRESGVGVEASLVAFDAGFREGGEDPTLRQKRAEGWATQSTEGWGSHLEMVDAGAAKCADYQDVKYAEEYRDRLKGIRELDERYGDGSFALLRETARYLALWMTYEDAVRVADLKLRRARIDRVRQESRAQEQQVVRIHEYLHPSVQEIADILPKRVGEWLLRSSAGAKIINGYTGNGRIVETTSLRGFLMLYFLAGRRKGRRRSLRFHAESEEIAKWLALVSETAKQDYGLAVELAQLPRLIKGYGDTHRRGMKNYRALIESLASLRGRADAAAILKNLREAALADESGEKLADALKAVAA